MHTSDKPRLNIRAIRESRGYTQEYMAEMLDICQSTYANMESGKSVMRVDRLLEICTILETDILSLFEQADVVKKDQHDLVKDRDQKMEMSVEVRQMYDRLIAELHSEIGFLRSIVKPQDHSKEL